VQPITISAAQKTVELLTDDSALATELAEISNGSLIEIPAIPDGQVYLSSASLSMAELQQELGYPRVAVASTRLRNTQAEKFRSLSGTATVIAEVAATGDMVIVVDTAIHFYVEAITNILRRNRGDWGDGVFYSGGYDVDIQAPQAGGSGFLQTARVTFDVGVSRD
jgi:hypothetical protein